MNTSSIFVAPQKTRRLRGFALISVITALMLALLLEALDLLENSPTKLVVNGSCSPVHV